MINMRNGLYTILLAVLVITGCTSVKTDPEAQKLMEQKSNSSTSEGWNAIISNDYEGAKYSFSEFLDEYADENTSLARTYRGLAIADFSQSGDLDTFDLLVDAISEDPGHSYSGAIAYFISSYGLYDYSRYGEYIGLIEKVMKKGEIPGWLKREYNHVLFNYYHDKMTDSKKYEEIRNNLDILTGWKILGPFSNVSGSGYNRDFVTIDEKPGSAFVDFEAGKNNWSLTPYYPKLNSSGLMIPLSDYLSNNSYSSIYAYKNIIAEKDGSYEFVFSRKGAIEVWLDGAKMLSNGIYSEGENLFYIRRNLTEGSHKLIVKCSNKEELSAFSASFSPAGERWANRTDLYNSLFPDESVFDPFINELCLNIEQSEDNREGYFWLSLVLIEKGWSKQALTAIEKFTLKGGESFLSRWLKSLYFRSVDNFTAYEQQMLKLADEDVIFAPARIYAIRNFISDGRIGKAKTFLEKIRENNANWYFTLESELRLYLAEENNDRAYDSFNKLVEEYPEVPGYYLTMLKFNADLTAEKMVSYIKNLYDKGEYLSALYMDYTYNRGRGYNKIAQQKILEYLEHSPILENLWVQYLKLLYDDENLTFMTIREKTKEISQSFPLSYDLQMMEMGQSRALYRDMKSYYEENTSLFSSYSTAVTQFKRDMEQEKNKYREALTKLVGFYPYDLSTRDELRKLKGLKEFDEELKIVDSHFIIDDFNKSGFDGNGNDGVVVYDNRKQIYFGDGASTVQQHFILKILTPAGIEDNRVQYLEFHPVFGNGDLKEAYILKEDGSKIYADRSGRKLAFPGLSIGDFIVVRYNVNAYVPGEINDHFWTYFTFQSTYPIYQSDLQLIYPESYEPAFEYHNIPEEKVNIKNDEFIDGYKRTTFSVSTSLPIEIGPLSPSWRDVYPWVDISTMKSWDELIEWYGYLYNGQTEVTPSILKKAEELTEGVDEQREKIVKLFNFVSGGIEYEDLSFQYSDYVPQTADSILNEGYGDCKDQSVLLISLLRALEIDSYIALNTPTYRGDHPYLPSLRFSHAIVVVPEEDGYLYLDPTTKYYTFEELPSRMTGSYVLHIVDGGEFTKIESDEEAQKTYYLLEVNDIDKEASLKGTVIYQGIQSGYMRSRYNGLENKDRDAKFTQITNSWMPGFSLNELQMENLDDLSIDPRIVFSGTLPDRISAIGNGIFKIENPWMNLFDSHVNSWIGISESLNGIDISDPMLSTPNVQTNVIYIPSKYSVLHMPEDVNLHFKDSFVKYYYRQNEGRILCTREIFIPNQRVSADEINAFRDFIYNAVKGAEESPYLKKIR